MSSSRARAGAAANAGQIDATVTYLSPLLANGPSLAGREQQFDHPGVHRPTDSQRQPRGQVGWPRRDEPSPVQ